MTRTFITIRVPSPLRDCCGGASKLSLPAASVRDVFEEFEAQYPALYRSVCDETGSVRPHVGVFVNSSHVRNHGGLDTPLAPGDIVSIFQAVSGG